MAESIPPLLMPPAFNPISGDDPLSYWRGTVDARLHILELALLQQTSDSDESRIALEGALRRTHEDICIELRMIHAQITKSDAFSNKMIGAIVLLSFLCSTFVAIALKFFFNVAAR